MPVASAAGISFSANVKDIFVAGVPVIRDSNELVIDTDDHTDISLVVALFVDSNYSGAVEHGGPEFFRSV